MSLPFTNSAHETLDACIDQSRLHAEASQLALLRTDDEAAHSVAAAYDVLLSSHPQSAPPLAGTVLTVKACFDVAGWVTHAGSKVLADQSAAAHDAPLVAQLRRAGAVLRAQTNMTEFAYGALGLNPWYGTPLTPLMQDQPRVAGGSSSGAAVATALGMATIGLGSDTSGSVRIPAAFCGVAGFKPSRRRYPDAGMAYLSPSFDVPGFITPSAAMCRKVDAALTGSKKALSPLRSLRLVVPEAWLSPLLDDDIGRAFEYWISRLVAAGAHVHTVDLPMLPESGRVASEGGIIAAEAYKLHADRVAARMHEYDPRVGPRIALGADIKAHACFSAFDELKRLAADYDAAMEWADLVLTPTVPMLPPTVASLQDDAVYTRQNKRAFQLTEFANRLALPSISLPGDLRDRQATGLLLSGKRGEDAALLAMAESIESMLSAA